MTMALLQGKPPCKTHFTYKLYAVTGVRSKADQHRVTTQFMKSGVPMSRSTRLALLALSASCLGLGACSTILTGTGQQIAISTPGVSDATCRLAGGDGVTATVNTPVSVHVPKSKKNIDITCTAPDRTATTQTIKSTYSDWSIVEYPLGYPIDAATGAMWVYPKTVAISFGGQASAAQATADGKAEAIQ